MIGRWLKLSVGFVLAGGLSLGIHALITDRFHVQPPLDYPHVDWAQFPDLYLRAVAIMYLAVNLDQRFQRLSLIKRCLLLTLLVATLRESVFRDPFMEVINGSPNFYPFLVNLKNLLTFACLSSAAVLLSRYHRFRQQPWGSSFLIAAVVFWICIPLIALALKAPLSSLAWMQGASLYNPPYDYHILIPAYLTFIEPTLGVFIAASLLWRNLPSANIARILAFTAFVVLIGGHLVKTFVYPIAVHGSILSEGQFLLEDLVLGTVTALVCLYMNPSVDVQTARSRI